MVVCVRVRVRARERCVGYPNIASSENDVHYFMRQGKKDALVTTDLVHTDLEELVVSVQLDHFDIYRRW